MTQAQEPEEPGLEIIVPPDQQAGVWANLALVTHSEHEFTLDFVRRDPHTASRGIVVARVSVSPLFVTQLQAALEANWQQYAQKALPKEIYDAGQEEDEGDG
jgi:hypothetical protein